MVPIVNPSLSFWHRHGEGKLLVLRILHENGTPMWRRKLSDTLQEMAISKTAERLTRERSKQAVRYWLEDLLGRGFVENPTFGYWNLTTQGLAFIDNSSSDLEKPKEVLSTEYIKVDCPKEDRQRKVLGVGNDKVYVYYFENDRIAALSARKTTWDVKVGRTSGDVDARVRGQGALTARSRPPIVALEIRTENADLLESALHAILKFCGLHLRKEGGSEWFDANPALVESIYFQLKAVETISINTIHIIE